ncbi:hypothetical protein [Moraxella lacunata]|uniref:hypothetical protein n=1 Tax=Moraxella lacunata TaxID=477 RepID=UPI003EE008D1
MFDVKSYHRNFLMFLGIFTNVLKNVIGKINIAFSNIFTSLIAVIFWYFSISSNNFC